VVHDFPRIDTTIDSVEVLTALYGPVNPNSLRKELPYLSPEYRAWIERSPFMAVATIGPEGLDCSPRGDTSGQLVQIHDDRTVLFADRRGNNRLDTLKNVVQDPRISLLFLLPGINECLRINGTAVVTTDEVLRQRFAMDDKLPVTVVVVTIGSVYFQCGRAVIRSGLWDPATHVTRDAVPTAGAMTKSASPDFDAETYDAELPGRQQATLY
jgi:uncharacterized protein